MRHAYKLNYFMHVATAVSFSGSGDPSLQKVLVLSHVVILSSLLYVYLIQQHKKYALERAFFDNNSFYWSGSTWT